MTGALMMWVVEKGSAEGRNLHCITGTCLYHGLNKRMHFKWQAMAFYPSDRWERSDG